MVEINLIYLAINKKNRKWYGGDENDFHLKLKNGLILDIAIFILYIFFFLKNFLYLYLFLLYFYNMILENYSIIFMKPTMNLTKRYYTKKKLKKLFMKKHYSVESENNNEYGINSQLFNGHHKQLLIPIKSENCLEYLNKSTFVQIHLENNKIIVNEANNFITKLDISLQNQNSKFKIMEKVKMLKLNNTNKLFDYYNNYGIINFKKKNKIIGIVNMNYTTNIKKNSLILVNSNKIKEQPLNKGIGLHTKMLLFGKINSDKDFVQVFTYIMINFNDDLKQKILIEQNTEIEDLEKLYNAQAQKILNQIGIKEIIINNKIKTKNQLLQYLYDNWLEIREK